MHDQALGGANIVATSFDSKREVLEKYANALANIEALGKLGVPTFHSVDATTLSASLATKNLVGCCLSERLLLHHPQPCSRV